MQSIEQIIEDDFHVIPDLLKSAALRHPDHCALRAGDDSISYADLDHLVDAVASRLQHDGLTPGQVVAICARTCIRYVAVYFGALRAGGVVAPLPVTAKVEHLDAMLDNCQAKWLFTDSTIQSEWACLQTRQHIRQITLDDDDGAMPFSDWIAAAGQVTPVSISPEHPFNLIYSSGTTGVPKGIVQPHGMRWSHVKRAWLNGYRPDSVVITGTPLYSNTTLVAVIPALVIGATVIMLEKFDALKYLQLAAKYRATHTILVPIQYQRILRHPQFDDFDLSCFKGKLCTSAPFSAELKAEVLDRWPGDLVEIYGMTEGGGRCELHAHLYRDKLHTVGKPAPGCEIRIIDDNGNEVPQGELGEVVGRSPAMMHGYHGLPDKTREAEWYSPEGLRFIRTGDVGRFDADGFLILGDRKKDMLISGGFNIYPSDLEAELMKHPAVRDCAVVGVKSERWGETPVGFVVLDEKYSIDPEDLLQWVNQRLGKIQRLAKLEVVNDLPRNPIGKVLKRDLREDFQQRYGTLA